MLYNIQYTLYSIHQLDKTISEVEKFTFPHIICLVLSIPSYEARMIIYARALYGNLEVKL